MDFPFFSPASNFPDASDLGDLGDLGRCASITWAGDAKRSRNNGNFAVRRGQLIRWGGGRLWRLGRLETSGDIWSEFILKISKIWIDLVFFWGLRVRPRAWFFALKRLCRMVFCENSKMCLLFTHTIWSTTSIAISVDHVQVKGSNRYGRYGLLQTTWAFDYPFKLNNWSPRPESMRIRNHTFCLYSVPISPVLRLVYQGNWGWQLRNYSKS